MPCTSPIHIARNQLLLNELKKRFELHIATYGEKDMKMDEIACDITPKFKRALDIVKPDLVIIRADRAELLPCAMLSVYGNYKVAQLECGDKSGTWDNKVRYAISHLADYHFTTNNDSQERMLKIGFDNVWNCGSLDVEYALSVKPSKLRSKPYILVLWHPVPFEDSNALYGALNAFPDYSIVGVRGNKDYGEKSSYKEWYSPEDFINLLRNASCLVGNSSAGLKEASVLGTPVVNVGTRQQGRTKPLSVLDCPCEEKEIIEAIRSQIGKRYEIDATYFQENCSQKIAGQIALVLGISPQS